MRILYSNHIFDATITPSSENSFYPFDTALNDTRLSRVGRTTGDTSENIVFEFTGAVTASYFAVLAHNFTGGATLTLEANTSDSWGAPPFSETITQYDDVALVSFTETSYQYWRLVMADASNPDTYLEIGLCFLGTFLQMPGLIPDYVFIHKSTSDAQKSVTGQLYGNEKLNLKALTINFAPIITRTSKNSIVTFWRTTNFVLPFIVLFWEEDLTVEAPIYMNNTRELEFTRKFSQGEQYGLSMELEETF